MAGLKRHRAIGKRRVEEATRSLERGLRFDLSRRPADLITDLELVRKLLRRSQTLHRPTEKALFTHKSEQRFRVALASLDMAEHDFEDVKPHGFSLARLKKSGIARLREEYLERLRSAMRERAQFICFGELAFPYWADMFGKPDAEYDRFVRQVEHMVAASGAVVLGGSFHCMQTFENRMPIFYREQMGGKQVVHHIFHAKTTSAAASGEFVRRRDGRALPFYTSQLGVFGVLICSDAFDPSVVYSVVLQNKENRNDNQPRDTKTLQVIFVPSFNPRNKAIQDACRELSIMARTLVCHVDMRDHRPPCYAFLCGEDVRPIRADKTSNKGVWLYEFDLERIRQARRRQTRQFTAVLRHLIDESFEVRR